MQVNQNITPFFGGKSTGRTCTICSDRFNQKSLGMKYLILMAARQDDKGIGGFLIWDCRFSIGHMPSASLGQYASLSFVVIGREKRIGERDFPVGAAFSRDLVL